MKKSSAKIQSVYRNQNALIRAVFERAGDARKVLCVALDYAKRKHVALICDGNGDVLKASFPVENNAAGIAHLIKEISATARHRKIPKEQIFLGGEDEAAYAANFTEALRAKGYLVVRVNACESKENRENLLASPDTLDLLGIAKTLLSRARPTHWRNRCCLSSLSSPPRNYPLPPRPRPPENHRLQPHPHPRRSALHRLPRRPQGSHRGKSFPG